MNPYPAVDPIPLPAPVWLMKLLHVVTLSLHFVAVEMLLGGLLLAILLSLFRSSAHAHVTARALARRLTVVMTYVINLGVPPLLFAQVLYGRALYTSSVLIGVYWIALIPTLILAYWLLYKFSARLDQGKSAWWVGLIAWLLAGGVARMLSTNMTLMLRPEAWRGMYSASAMGAFLPTGDPTLDAALAADDGGRVVHRRIVAGVSGGAQHIYRGRKEFVGGLGGKVAAGFGIVYLAAGLWAASVQPDAVKTGLAGHALYPAYKFAGFAGYGWIALVVVAVLVGAIAGFGKITAGWLSWTAVLAGGAGGDHADGVSRWRARRDTSSKGYDVWDRAVVTNWGVVGLFLVLFVAGLGVVGWLVSVVARAQKTMEGAA